MSKVEPTRAFSDAQEKRVCRLLDGFQVANSGAGHFCKSDVIVKAASLGIECKTSTTAKSSFSIKREWLEKSREEGFQNRLTNTALAFSFGPDQPDYYIINERLMAFLTEKLREEESR